MLPSAQIREVTVKDYLIIIRRRAWIIAACFFVVTLWSTINTFKKIPLYRASAKIIIERAMPQIAPIQQVYSPSYWVDREYYQSQISLLRSRSLAKKVVENLIAAGDQSFVGLEEPESAFLGEVNVGGVNVLMITNTQMIDVGYITTDAIKAAKFANALVQTYIQQDMDKRSSAAKSATGWLSTQLLEIRKNLDESEFVLNDFIQKNEIISLPDIEKRTEGVLEGLKQEKVRLENELAEISKRYREKHPKFIALTTRLESVNKSIEEETKKLLVLNEKMMQYNTLKREAESNRTLYESLLKRTKETEVSKELETTNIEIVDLADVPRAPFSPDRKKDITYGVLLGLVFGLVLALTLEYLDSTVKTAEDVEMYVRLPFLGYVPSARAEAKTEKDIDLLTFKLPHSRIAEAYRSIRTSIIFSSPEDKPLKTILITSTSPQEGKTTVSINLGLVFAQSNEKTLIVEADMRKPRIHNLLGQESKEGLSNLLAGTASLETVIKPTLHPNLFLISSGPKPPNPAELLTSGKTRRVLEELKNAFDRIIIDSPPLLTVADSAILANIVDGVIDIIRASFLNVGLILRGRQRLNEVKARTIGVILNNVNVKREDSYYYYHYYYSEEKQK